MKDEVEGTFIPIKTYDLVLPEGYKPEETQQFTNTLPVKKSEKPKASTVNNKETCTVSNAEEENDDSESIFPNPTKENPQESGRTAPKTMVLKPKPAPDTKSSIARPLTAKTYKVPKYLESNQGKTIQEIDDVTAQKQGAQAFVANWLKKADEKREESLKDLALNYKPASHFDNKLTDEINELMKRLKNTRRGTANSIKNMRKTLDTKSELPVQNADLKNNPFRTSIVIRDGKEIKNGVASLQKLDLRSLYSTETVPNNWVPYSGKGNKEAEEALISDDETFVNSIEFDEI